MDPRIPLLTGALRANAAFSVLTGVTLLGFAPALAAWTGLGPVWLLRAVGGGLLLFALDVGLLSRHAVENPARVRLVIGMDLAWVAGSAVLLLAAPATLTRAGFWIVLGVAEIVALFALLQYLGLRRAGAAVAATR